MLPLIWVFFEKNLFTILRLFKKWILFFFNFLFHNSHDKFDRQIIVPNQIESWKNVDVFGSDKKFGDTKAQTLGPECNTVYRSSEPSVITLSYAGTP